MLTYQHTLQYEQYNIVGYILMQSYLGTAVKIVRKRFSSGVSMLELPAENLGLY
jgi:hypothetical protein